VQKLHEIAKHLYENETITGEEFMDILNSSENTLLSGQPQE
jgi:cell division protease FtsH